MPFCNFSLFWLVARLMIVRLALAAAIVSATASPDLYVSSRSFILRLLVLMSRSSASRNNVFACCSVELAACCRSTAYPNGHSPAPPTHSRFQYVFFLIQSEKVLMFLYLSLSGR
ncbi:hypothetical protein J3E72DRAFT_271073 [Bipolaris maydis]|nr:hypothetical protein J3E72DRAFT_271073 [Bipolaris maydis]